MAGCGFGKKRGAYLTKRDSVTPSPTKDPKSPKLNMKWPVDKLIKRKFMDGEWKYCVKWLGYPRKLSTWEPAKNLMPECSQMIHEIDHKYAMQMKNAFERASKSVINAKKRSPNSKCAQTTTATETKKKQPKVQLKFEDDLVHDKNYRIGYSKSASKKVPKPNANGKSTSAPIAIPSNLNAQDKSNHRRNPIPGPSTMDFTTNENLHMIPKRNIEALTRDGLSQLVKDGYVYNTIPPGVIVTQVVNVISFAETGLLYVVAIKALKSNPIREPVLLMTGKDIANYHPQKLIHFYENNICWFKVSAQEQAELVEAGIEDDEDDGEDEAGIEDDDEDEAGIEDDDEDEGEDLESFSSESDKSD